MTQSDPILDPLNPPQREAVLHTRGPLLILAGAGSGKTRALTHRIAYIMREGTAPDRILAVTFTNKAAEEMKSRIMQLLRIAAPFDAPFGFAQSDRNPRVPVMGTFHSICARILRRDIEHLGRDRDFVIYDTDDQERLMKQVLRDLQVNDATLKPRAALAAIGRFKAEAMGPKEAAPQATTDRMQLILRAHSAYNAALRRNNALDFDDLLLEVVRLWHECPAVLARYQATWTHLCVDEYQDTNHAQYLFATLLAHAERNICVIGDPDQSIYGFRGADIRNILEFERDYPDVKRIALEQNYRSVQPILTAADTVIAANPNRPSKRMWTEQKEGPKIVVHELADERAEAAEAIATVQRLRERGIALREQAILYRTHAQSRLFEEACMRAGLPYRILGGMKFYGRREVKDVLAYLHLLLNPYDTVAMLRVINIPSRKIGETTLARLQAFCSARGMALWDALQVLDDVPELEPPARQRLRAFAELITRARRRAKELPARPLCSELLHDLKMEEWLADGTDEGEQRWENVRELLSVMEKYNALPPRLSLQSFLEEAALVSEVDALAGDSRDVLTLMTLHLCKGLEFTAVQIVGCEDGIFPISAALFDRAQIEEERRILYVGMTRAKTHLQLLLARSRLLWGERMQNPPSRFLDDLPESCIERRSDSVLSAFAWATQSAEKMLQGDGLLQEKPSSVRRTTGTIEPYRQEEVQLEFNQDIATDDGQAKPLQRGARVEHPAFGAGTVLNKRGDVVEVRFDSGQQKRLALSIAPLRLL